MLLGAALFSTTSCSERVDAGSEGILVNLYGSDKGVDDVSLVTGRVWYNPFTEEVYEYPTYVQTIDYPAFTINAKDGSEFTVDPTVSLKMVDGNAPRVFKKYRKGLDDIVNGTLFNYVKDAFRIQLNKYTTDQIVSNRDLVEKAIEAQLSKALAKEHFHLEQLTSGLKYPSSIVEAVNQKNKAIQEAQRALNEVAVKKAEAEKMLVQAKAEREANELKTASLTPAILQKMWIEKWDGKLPVNIGLWLEEVKFARKVLVMNPAGCISVCMARSVRSYVASVALKLASPAGTTSTCFGRFLATDIITR